MALIKTGKGITDIRGKFGGTVFKRDGSGLHAIAKPRHIQQQPTDAAQRCRYWYQGKKHDENTGGTPLEQYELPNTENSAIIYSLESIWAHCQPSLTAPEQKTIEYSGFYHDQIWHWIQVNWNPAWAIWGLSKDIMFLMMLKWMYIIKSTWGFSWAVAVAGAKTNMANFIAAEAGAVAVPFLGLWLGLIGMDIYFAFLEWLDGWTFHTGLPKGAVLIRKRDSLWWGGFRGRPTKKMFEFGFCAPAPFGSYNWHITPDTPKYQLHWLGFNQLWQSVQSKLIWHYVYTWHHLWCRYRGMAYKVYPGIYRLQCPLSQQNFWNVPVGWETPWWMSCQYLDWIPGG